MRCRSARPLRGRGRSRESRPLPALPDARALGDPASPVCASPSAKTGQCDQRRDRAAFVPAHASRDDRAHNACLRGGQRPSRAAWSRTRPPPEPRNAGARFARDRVVGLPDLTACTARSRTAAARRWEIVLPGMLGPAGTQEKPLLPIDAALHELQAASANDSGAPPCRSRARSTTPPLGAPGFRVPSTASRPSMRSRAVIVVIPYGNPTGQFCPHESLVQLARLCVKHDLRNSPGRGVPRGSSTPTTRRPASGGSWRTRSGGIRGRRVSIETTSKVWNACGLRRRRDRHGRSGVPFSAARWPSTPPGGPVCERDRPADLRRDRAGSRSSDLNAWCLAAAGGDHRAMLASFTRRTRGGSRPARSSRVPDAAIYSIVDLRNVAASGVRGSWTSCCTARRPEGREGREGLDRCSPLR